MAKGGWQRLEKLIVLCLVLGLVVALPAQASHRTDPTTCTCSARLSVARPSLQFTNGVLTLLPRLDLSLTSRGPITAPGWTATLTHSGTATYSSEDVGVPESVTFSGERVVARGACGNRYTIRGLHLPAVPLTGLTSTLVGHKQELAGTVQLHTAVAGCGFAEENRHLTFSLREFGKLRVGSWRSVR